MYTLAQNRNDEREHTIGDEPAHAEAKTKQKIFQRFLHACLLTADSLLVPHRWSVPADRQRSSNGRQSLRPVRLVAADREPQTSTALLVLVASTCPREHRARPRTVPPGGLPPCAADHSCQMRAAC